MIILYDNKDKRYIVYTFLILFGIAILMLCVALREARDDIESGYAEQTVNDGAVSQLTEVISDGAE